MKSSIYSFFLFSATLALLWFMAFRMQAPVPPELTRQQQTAIYAGPMDTFTILGAMNGEGDSPLKLAEKLSKAGFDDEGRSWRDFHARNRAYLDMLNMLVWGAVIAIGLAGLKQFFFPAASPPAGTCKMLDLLAAEAAPVFMMLLFIFLFGHLDRSGEFVKLTDSIPLVYGLCYLFIAIKNRFKTWYLACKDASLVQHENAAAIFEFSAAAIIVSIWGSRYAYYQLEMGTFAETGSALLRAAAMLFPWLMMRYHPRYRHLPNFVGLAFAAIPVIVMIPLAIVNYIAIALSASR